MYLMPCPLVNQKNDEYVILGSVFVRIWRMADGRDEWVTRARRFLKAELKRAEVTYEELARRLGEMGIEETKGSVTVKVNRGAFPAWFLFAVMKAIGVAQVRLEDV
jgi:3-mercaptopyruvate sulfurtransferase SseA